MKTFCYDLDGVICELTDEDYSDRKLIKKTRAIMIMQRRAGHLIIIHTGRHLNHMMDTKAWLTDNDVPYDHIQFGKPVADLYIDDKGVDFKQWTTQTEYWQ